MEASKRQGTTKMKLQTIIIAGLLIATVTASAQLPRHIYRDGQYFFCPYPDYDPYCRMPSDYSRALQGPPWNRDPRTPSVLDPHVPFALRTPPSQWAPPQQRVAPPIYIPAPGYVLPPSMQARRSAHPPPLSMEQSRERVIEMGEAHCRAFPQDSICHRLPPQ
jgi:hypothetical protein